MPHLPDPAEAGSFDGLVERLRQLKAYAGDPSFDTITERVVATWTAGRRPARSTVANAFQPGRRRLNTELVLAVVRALHPDDAYVAGWRRALRVVAGESEAVSQVRVQASLPQDLPEFTGRLGELDTLWQAATAGDAVVISAVEGMAGVGKTQLAVHAAHSLHEKDPFDQVLFVNLRGFHPDRSQPPADPAAVLDGFLRLLGVPGHQVPHGLDALAAAYRERLTGVRALVVLDNAGDTEQVRPLLPATPGCLTLITSRRRLTGLPATTHLAVDVFSPPEAVGFLAGAVAGVAPGPDPEALAAIARHCGYLPLALGLIAGHIRSTPGWDLTDHADRLDQRHRERRIDSGVELALDLSYRHLPADRQRVLRLAALHPGQDFGAYAVAALTGGDRDAARAALDHLRADHLLVAAAPGRYGFHDLVRAYASERAHDEERPAERHAALTRLFDHYLTAAAAAMEPLYPGEVEEVRAGIPEARTPVPDLTGPDAALAWLETERPTLVAVAAHTAAHGWPSHTTRLARTVARYLGGGQHNDSLTVHGHALRAARGAGDVEGQAFALSHIGVAHLRLSRPGPAEEHLREAFELFRRAGDETGQGRVLFNLGLAAERAGRYAAAIDYRLRALDLVRRAGHRDVEATILAGLGSVLDHAGRLDEAAAYYQQSLTVARETGNLGVQAGALHGLGELDVREGRLTPAVDHLGQAIQLYRQTGNRHGEAGALDSLGALHTRLGQVDPAVTHYEQALAIFRDAGNQDHESWVLNGLGEAVRVAGRHTDALAYHAAAAELTAAIGNRHQLARAHRGQAAAHRALGDPVRARAHYEQALTLYAGLGVPDADEVRAELTTLDDAR